MMNSVLLSVLLGLVAPASEVTPVAETSVSAEHAARLYRISIYDTFRTERPEYNRRRELGDKVWNRFEALGRPQSEYHEVTDWFIAARAASVASPAGELPPLPEFASLPPVAGAAEGFIPVATSAPEERVRIDVPPAGSATRLDVTLPREAVQTGPTRFFSSLIRTAVKAATVTEDKPELSSTTISHPKAAPQAQPEVALPEATPLEVTLPVEATPTKFEPETAVGARPAINEKDLGVNFDELFSPATTPADRKPATDADPFSP